MRIKRSQLRQIIRRTIKESLDEITPEQQDLLDKEVEKLQSTQRYLEQYPKAYSKKEFLMNIYHILQALVEGQHTVDDFQSWVGKRWPDYTIPMYQHLLDTVFEEKPY